MDTPATAVAAIEPAPTALVLWCEKPISATLAPWPLGSVYTIEPTVKRAWETIHCILQTHPAGFILFWDQRLGMPDPDLICSLQQEPGDVWHAGLSLGLRGKPEEIDYISPTWALNRDLDPTSKGVSWRLSLRACLMRIQVLCQLGQLDLAFESLGAAGLELGYRLIWRGAIIFHTPKLLAGPTTYLSSDMSSADRYVFIARHFQPAWLRYIFLRRCFAGGSFLRERKALQLALRRIGETGPAFQIEATYAPDQPKPASKNKPQISVLIPTLCRYTYLTATLNYLRQQTVKPCEVICVDQTPEEERREDIYYQFPDLNLRVIWMAQPGQCSARNAGLAQVKGDLILFLDDDVEIEPDYLERLYEGMQLYQADISVGVWYQGKEFATHPMDRHYRASDRLDTGGSLAKRSVVLSSGGFDLHYNRNYRADADLGMRLYLSGAISIITPYAGQNSLSPPTGGLKFYGATGDTRKTGLLQPWPAVTQTYYWLRYFTPRQVREAFLLSLLTMMSPIRAKPSNRPEDKLLAFLGALGKLPFRLYGAWRSIHVARRMLSQGTRIPGMSEKNDLL